MYVEKKAAKMTFVRNIRAYNIDEIDHLSQFHQHFTRAFFVQMCFAQFFFLFILALHFLAKEYQQKSVPKMLMKLTTGSLG